MSPHGVCEIQVRLIEPVSEQVPFPTEPVRTGSVFTGSVTDRTCAYTGSVPTEPAQIEPVWETQVRLTEPV